jgi:hypothetical protein
MVIDFIGTTSSLHVLALVATSTLLIACWIYFFKVATTTTQHEWQSSTSPSSTDPTTAPQLIIDGCNGPIRLADRLVNDKKHSWKCVSMLRVINGENKGDRMDIVPKLDNLLVRDSFGTVRILFDGVGKKSLSIEGSKWMISPRISIEVTSIKDEADNVIVEEVSKLQPTKAHLIAETNLSALLLHGDEFTQETVYRVRRTSEGPGRSRGVLQPLGLMRPDSVYCMFGFPPSLSSKAIADAKRLRPMERLMKIEHVRVVDGGHMTVVVTDDIFLRERVVEAGGFPMTFEQFWDLLTAQ